MNSKVFRVEQVAAKLNRSVQTINSWYRFKHAYPEHEFAKMLPQPLQESPKAPRYWTECDVKQLKKFASSIPKGRSGVMGQITQKYCKRKKGENNAKKKNIK